MEQIKQFIDMVASGNNSEARETLDGLLSTRAFEALEYKKQELASTLFAGQVEEEVEELDELSKETLKSYLRSNSPGSETENHRDLSKKALSIGRKQQDKDDARSYGNRLARRKLGEPGTMPAKVMAK